MKKIVINTQYGGFGLSEEAKKLLNIDSAYEIERDNQELVSVVEKLGNSANDCYSHLEIEEYDDDNYTYYIRDYDGKEQLVLEPIVNIQKIMSISNSPILLKEYFNKLGIKYRLG